MNELTELVEHLNIVHLWCANFSVGSVSNIGLLFVVEQDITTFFFSSPKPPLPLHLPPLLNCKSQTDGIASLSLMQITHKQTPQCCLPN